MRLQGEQMAAAEDVGGDLQLTVDGTAVIASRGQTVAAVLSTVHPNWELPVPDGPGSFCGIGACSACLVTVDGVTGTRACLVAVQEGMNILTERRLA